MAGNDKNMEKYLETLRKQKVEKEASKLSARSDMTMEEARALLETKSKEQIKKKRVERQLGTLMEERKNAPTPENPVPKAILEKTDPIEPEEIVENSVGNSVMDRYTEALKTTPSGKASIFEQDLQNTSASMKDVKNLEMSIRNIQTSLTSLGGGGLGEMDVLRLIADNATNLDSADLDYIASQIDDEFTDSAEVLQLINETVDSAFVNALVDASVSDALDSAEAIKLIGETVDSAYVNALVDINTSLDSNDYQQIADRIDDEFTDSAEVLALINETVDSGYVNALVDAGLADAFDSAQVINVVHDTVDANYITDRIGVPLDSSDVQPMIDASIAGLDTYDSAQVLGQINATVDSGYVNALVDINTSLDSSDYDAIADRVSDDFLDSAEALALILSTVDSGYVNALVDTPDIDAFDSSEVIDLISNTIDSAYIDGLGYIKQEDVDITFANAPHVVPTDLNQTLGTALRPWKELYVDGASIHLGSLKLTDDAGSFKVVNDSSNAVVKINLEDNFLNEIGDVTLDLANLDSDDFLVWDGTKWVNRELDLSGLEFQQTVDLTTDTAPASPSTGDLYINSTAGTIDASWTGIGGQTASELQAVVWSGSSSQWYLTTELGSGAVTSIGSSTPSLRVDDTDASAPVLSIANASADSAGLMSSAHYTKVESGLDSDIDALKTLLQDQNDSDHNALDSKIDDLDSDISALETRVDGHDTDIGALQDVDSAQNVRMDGIDSDIAGKLSKTGGDTMQGPLEITAQDSSGRVTNKVQTLGIFTGSDGSALRLGTTRDRVYIGHNDTQINGPLYVGEIHEKTVGAGTTFANNISVPTPTDSDHGVNKQYVDSALGAFTADSDLAVQVAENTDDIVDLKVDTLKNTIFNSTLIEEGVTPTGMFSEIPVSNAIQDVVNGRIISWRGYGLVDEINASGGNGLLASHQLSIVDTQTDTSTTRGILNSKRVAESKGNRYELMTLSPPFKLGDDWIFTSGENPKDTPFFKLKPDNTFEPYGLNEVGYVDSSDDANNLPKICRSWGIINHRVRLDPSTTTSGMDGGRYHLFVGNPVDRLDPDGGNGSRQAQVTLLLDVQDLIDGNEIETYVDGGRTYSALTKTLSSSRGGIPAVISGADGSPDVYLFQPGRPIHYVNITDLATKAVTLQTRNGGTDLYVTYLYIDGKRIAELGKINGLTVIDNRYIVYHALNVGIQCYDTVDDTLTTLQVTDNYIEYGTNRTKGNQAVPQLFGGTYFFPTDTMGYDPFTAVPDLVGYRISDTLEVTEITIPYSTFSFKSSSVLGSDTIGLSDFSGKVVSYHVITGEWNEVDIGGRVMGTFPFIKKGDIDQHYVPLVFNEQGLNNASDPWVPERFYKVSDGLNHEVIEESNFLLNDVLKEHDDFVKQGTQDTAKNERAYNMTHRNRSAIVSNRDALDDILFPRVKVATELEDTKITAMFELAALMAPDEHHPLYNIIDQNFILMYRMYEGSKKGDVDGTVWNNTTVDTQRYGNDHLPNLMLYHIPTGKTEEIKTMYVHRPDDKGLPDGVTAFNMAFPSPRGIHMIPREDGSLDCYLWINNPLRTNHPGGLSQMPKDEACPLYRIHIPATEDIDNSTPFDNITKGWTNIRCPAAEFTFPAVNNYQEGGLASPPPAANTYQYEISQFTWDMIDAETNKRHYFAMSHNKGSSDFVTARTFEIVFDDNDPDEGSIVPVGAHAESSQGVYASGWACKKKDIHDVERVFMFGSPMGLTELYFKTDSVTGNRVSEIRNYSDYIPQGTRVTHPTLTNAIGHPLIEERGIYDNWYKSTTNAIQPLTLNPYDENDELSNILVWWQSSYGLCSLSVKNLGDWPHRTRLENNFQGTNLSCMHIENRMNIYNGYIQDGSSKNLLRFQHKLTDTHSYGSIWFFPYKSDYPFDTDGTNLNSYGSEKFLYNSTREFDGSGNLVSQYVYKRPIIQVKPDESNGRLEIHAIPVGQKHHPSQVEENTENFSGESIEKVNDVFILTGAKASHSSIKNPRAYMFNPTTKMVQRLSNERVDMTSTVASRQHGTVFGSPYGPNKDDDTGSKMYMIDMLAIENSSTVRSQASTLRKIYTLTGNDALMANDPDTWALDSAQTADTYVIDQAADSDWDLSWQDSAGTFSDSA